MSAITIAKSKNGWLVINRELSSVGYLKLDKAIAQIRILMKEKRSETK